MADTAPPIAPDSPPDPNFAPSALATDCKIEIRKAKEGLR